MANMNQPSHKDGDKRSPGKMASQGRETSNIAQNKRHPQNSTGKAAPKRGKK